MKGDTHTEGTQEPPFDGVAPRAPEKHRSIPGTSLLCTSDRLILSDPQVLHFSKKRIILSHWYSLAQNDSSSTHHHLPSGAQENALETQGPWYRRAGVASASEPVWDAGSEPPIPEVG